MRRFGHIVVARASFALAAFLAVGTLLVGTGATASAHARFESSDPAPNAVLKQAPSSVTIHFAESVNPASSDIIVYDQQGKQVSTGKAQVDPADLKTLKVAMQGSDSETYVVVWHNASADDGHPDAGSFTFGVGTPDADAGTAGATSSGGSSGTPGWVVALVGVLGLAVGGAGGFFAARRAR